MQTNQSWVHTLLCLLLSESCSLGRYLLALNHPGSGARWLGTTSKAQSPPKLFKLTNPETASHACLFPPMETALKSHARASPRSSCLLIDAVLPCVALCGVQVPPISRNQSVNFFLHDSHCHVCMSCHIWLKQILGTFSTSNYLGLAFFTQYNFLEIHPGCRVYQEYASFYCEYVPWYGCPSLFRHLLIDIIWVVSNFSLFGIFLQYLFMYRFLCEPKSSFPWDKWPGVQLLGYVVATYLVFKRNRLDFPGGKWRSGWESACQCRGHGFKPRSGKVPHAAERLGPWATIAEPARLEPVLRNKRGHDSGIPAHRDEEWPPLAATRESPRAETKTQHSHK